ncbi:hypothetical protein GOBAR_AA38770 [Gossypium barbadense]|uniref:Uncharacterized protein n=1 Tax=Gossypium barbadense TaxID=3634 RepID=A0A2P5VSX1_GOSBA|nr:hypothetical protein GOBAR_AA38770 [Gossypium barbadense]
MTGRLSARVTHIRLICWSEGSFHYKEGKLRNSRYSISLRSLRAAYGAVYDVFIYYAEWFVFKRDARDEATRLDYSRALAREGTFLGEVGIAFGHIQCGDTLPCEDTALPGVRIF